MKERKTEEFSNVTENIINEEFKERQMKRLELLNSLLANETPPYSYKVDAGVYNVEIKNVVIKTNVKGNDFIEFICENLSENGPKKLYAIYYLTEAADNFSIHELWNLMFDYNLPRFTKEDIVDDYLILEKLKSFINKKSQLRIEKGAICGKLYKEYVL